MRFALDCIKAFHTAMDISPQQEMTRNPELGLKALGELLVRESAALEKHACESVDQRWMRAHLMVEELGEAIIAMGEGDYVTMLDGLSDLLYVIFGTAVVFDMPLPEAFIEVHLSNMTKVRQKDDKSSARVRQKGQEFKPPDLEKVIEQYQNRTRTNSQDFLTTLEKRWLEKHPRRWNALTNQNHALLETAVDALLKRGKIEDNTIRRLLEIRDEFRSLQDNESSV